MQFSVQLSAAESATLIMTVHPVWAPIGTARFLALVDAGFFDQCPPGPPTPLGGPTTTGRL